MDLLIFHMGVSPFPLSPGKGLRTFGIQLEDFSFADEVVRRFASSTVVCLCDAILH